MNSNLNVEDKKKISETFKVKGLMPTNECLANSHTPEANAKRAKALMKPVTVSGIEYPSIKDAANYLGISKKCMEHRLDSNTEKFKNYKRL